MLGVGMGTKIIVIFALVSILDSFITLSSINTKEVQKTKIEPKSNRMEVYESKDAIKQLDSESLEMLAICVEAEAGNQDIFGKRLVVDVILNRVDSDRFPDDIESVISQKYHFTTFWNGEMDKISTPSNETFDAIDSELKHRIDDEILFFTSGAYNKYCIPAYKHGDHYFGY